MGSVRVLNRREAPAKSWKVKITPPTPGTLGMWQADLYYDPPNKPLEWCDVAAATTREEVIEAIRLKAYEQEHPPDVEWIALP